MLDFPHLMLRYRVAELKKARPTSRERQLARNRSQRHAGGAVAPLANWAVKTRQQADPWGDGKVAQAWIAAPSCRNSTAQTFRSSGEEASRRSIARRRPSARKAALYATCFVNYNDPQIGEAARAVLARNGRGERGRLSHLLRHAEARAGRDRKRCRCRA